MGSDSIHIDERRVGRVLGPDGFVVGGPLRVSASLEARSALDASPELPVAVCVLVRRDDRFLFVERAPGRPSAGYWTPITGRVEPGETLDQAAVREVLEETGLAVTLGRSLGRTGTDLPGGGSAGYVLAWFEARSPEGELALQRDEVAAARWVALDEALRLEPLFPTTRRFLADLRERPSAS